MRRREFITLVGGAATLPIGARAQQQTGLVRRIGYLGTGANNTYGFFANGTGSTGVIAVQIKDSAISGSLFNGISAHTTAGGSITSVVVDHSSSLLSGEGGILAQSSRGFVTLTDSSVFSNVTGVSSVSGGSIYSYGNNRLSGNVSDGASPMTGVFALK